MFHLYQSSIKDISLPQQFTYPFCYTPHPLCVLAVAEVQAYLTEQTQWQNELEQGKMFGVLVVKNTRGDIGYLAAFSGILAGKNNHSFFVPPVYDLLQPDGFFKIEEEAISAINLRIEALSSSKDYLQNKQLLAEIKQQAVQALQESKLALKKAKQKRDRLRKEHALNPSVHTDIEKALIKESQFQKAEYKRLEKSWKEKIFNLQQEVKNQEDVISSLKQERKYRSAQLQQQLFEQFNMLNAQGAYKNLCDIFRETVQKTPPAGAGECAAPKLLQYAYLNHYQPIAMAEFWWGQSPKTEIREHGHYYPSCKSKCEPILGHMLQGLNVEENPMLHKQQEAEKDCLEIIYEDEWLVAVNKPAGMLSVPGKDSSLSVYDHLRKRYPNAEGPIMVHRLDMDTSGVLLAAKTKEAHKKLQADFFHHRIQKKYIALLNGHVTANSGNIDLPLCPNIDDRPRQMVSQEYGKPAHTHFKVLKRTSEKTRIAFFPLTGRTHQLRVHAAHLLGLHCPIVGDPLYGTQADRLYLHAEKIELTHPMTGEPLILEVPAPF